MTGFKDKTLLGQIDRYELPPDEMIPVLKAMTPGKRLETAFYLARLARKMMVAQATAAHPNWSSEQVQAEVAGRILRGAE